MCHIKKWKELGMATREKREPGCSEGAKAWKLSANSCRAEFEGMIRLILSSLKVPQEAMSPLSFLEFKKSFHNF